MVPSLSVGNAPAEESHFFVPTSFAEIVPTPAERPTASIVSTSGEPSILVDQNGQWIWVGDFQGVHRSTNGVTWTRSVPQQAPGAFIDGFALAQDAYSGALYSTSTTGQWIAVDKSFNGGQTWTQINRFAAIGLPFADRPWIVTGPAPEEVTLIYNGNGGEGCMHSTDGGVTFVPGSTAELPVNAGNVVRDDFGNTYFVPSSRDMIYMWKGPEACPIHVPGLPLTHTFKAFPASGAQILTQLAVPAGTGTTVDGGHVYVAVPTVGNGQMVVHGVESMRTIPPVPVKTVVISTPAMKSNTFAAIAVMPDDSEIAVSWYASPVAGDPSSSSYPASATWSVYAARITNFWSANPTVTVELVESGNYKGWFCMGGVSCTSGRSLADYHGITYAADGKLHVVWGHQNSGNSVDVRYANLG